MNADQKKQAREDYKARKTVPGIFAVRCAASGQVWVGHAPNLDTIQNRIWFQLRVGVTRIPSLDSAWASHGESSFTFEPLERMEDDALMMKHSRDVVLKERAAFWRTKLDALSI